MRKYGFTLIEVLVTVVIIGLLATITVYSYGAALSRSRDQQRLTDLANISNTLEQYYLDHKTYPKVSTNPNQIISANFQLDKTIQLYDGVSRCTVSGTTNSNFLTPIYATSIPEDPQNKLKITANGGSCISNSQNGQYLYITNDENLAAPHSYLLMAKMERQTNASTSVPTITPSFSTYFTPGSLCNQSNMNNIGCIENYYLGTRNGQ